MKVEVDAVTETERKLNVELPAHVVKEEFARMYRQLGLRAKVRGFRPGKIPRHVLEGLYGTEVQAQALSELVEQSLLTALQQHELHVVGQPRVETGELKDGEAFSFSAVVEVKPNIELKDYRGIDVERVRLEVQEEQVDANLGRLQDRHAQLEPVESRDIVARGDFVFIDFTGTIDGEPFPGGRAEKFALEVGAGKTIPEFENALIGLQKEHEAAVNVHMPDDFGDPAVAGKDAVFRVMIQDIKRKILPQLDDEFAKDYGDCSSLEELREKIRAELKKELDSLQARQLKDQIVQRMVDQYDFVVSPSLVEKELAYMVSRAQAQGGAEASNSDAPTTEDLKNELRPEAVRRVKAMLLVEKVAQQENIDVSADEVNQRIDLIVRAGGEQGAAVRDYYNREDARRELGHQIVSEKTLAFLLQHATIRDVEPPSNMVDAPGKKG